MLLILIVYPLPLLFTGRLNKPILDLNLGQSNRYLKYADYVIGLPGGEALVGQSNVYYRRYQLKRIDKYGNTTKKLYRAKGGIISGIFKLGNRCYVLDSYGKLVELTLNGRILNTYTIPQVRFPGQRGPLAANPDLIKDKDLLILPDLYKGEVFSYRLSTKKKTVHLSNVMSQCVTHGFYKGNTYYLVSDSIKTVVRIFNTDWTPVKTIGVTGRTFGPKAQFNPQCAVMTEDGHVIISDNINNRMSEYDFDGKFIGHLLTKADGIDTLQYFSIEPPYLWFTKPTMRFKLYSN